MRYSEARLGRIFVVRLEDGDIVHQCLESLARAEKVRAATITLVGGLDEGSRLVVGPLEPREAPPVIPMQSTLRGVHEVAGVGTLFPDEKGEPVVHVHMACGRENRTTTGCIRLGVRVWHVMEAIVTELLDTSAMRKLEPESGFELLSP